MPAPRRLARIAGLLYLIMGVCGAFAEIVRVTVYKAGDAATTAANVATHAGLVRASVVADLVAVPTALFTAMAVYLLLQHVHANAARTMVAPRRTRDISAADSEKGTMSPTRTGKRKLFEEWCNRKRHVPAVQSHAAPRVTARRRSDSRSGRNRR